MAAIQLARYKILKKMLNNMIDVWNCASRRHLQRRPPDRGYEPLHLAAEGGHLEVVVALLAAGASVDAKDDKGCGPQRRDGCDRTDVVGKAVPRFSGWNSMVFATLAGDEPPAGESHRVDNLKEIRHMKSWSCPCWDAQLRRGDLAHVQPWSTLYGCKRVW